MNQSYQKGQEVEYVYGVGGGFQLSPRLKKQLAYSNRLVALW